MGTEPLLTRQDPNGAARSFEEPHIDRTAPAPAGEESRLDEAMRRADDLLITSLRDEEARRRGRRRRVLLASAASGALIMGIIIIAILTGLLGNPGGKRAAGTGGGGDADALAKQGWALWQSGDAEAAQAKFAAAVELDPHNANTWNGLGWSRLRSGKHKEAEQAFAEAVKLEPEHGAALNGLGLRDTFKGAGLLTQDGKITDAKLAFALATVGAGLFREDASRGAPGHLTANNPWKDGQENLTEQGRILKQNPDLAKSLILAAGKDPNKVLYKGR